MNNKRTTLKKLVTIIVPAYNESLLIDRLLKSIKDQSYQFIEIIVVDDGSSDGTVDVARKYTDRVYARSHKERSIQRNFGAGKAKGKYLFFLDSDMELSENVVSDCVGAIENDNQLGGVIIPEKSIAKSFWGKVKAYERSFYNEDGDSATDAARFFKRSVFEEAGGYDETITGPEDWE
jgi:glycosyltransferase involved in cell wall biosynthesis